MRNQLVWIMGFFLFSGCSTILPQAHKDVLIGYYESDFGKCGVRMDLSSTCSQWTKRQLNAIAERKSPGQTLISAAELEGVVNRYYLQTDNSYTIVTGTSVITALPVTFSLGLVGDRSDCLLEMRLAPAARQLLPAYREFPCVCIRKPLSAPVRPVLFEKRDKVPQEDLAAVQSYVKERESELISLHRLNPGDYADNQIVFLESGQHPGYCYVSVFCGEVRGIAGLLKYFRADKTIEPVIPLRYASYVPCYGLFKYVYSNEYAYFIEELDINSDGLQECLVPEMSYENMGITLYRKKGDTYSSVTSTGF